MHLLIVSATAFEIAPLLHYLDDHAEKQTFFDYTYHGHQVYPLVTGVGQFMTGFNLSRYPSLKDVDLAINVGVAGSFNLDIALGSVVEVVKDRFADLGVEEQDGAFTDVYEMELSDGNMYPFQNGWIAKESTKYQSVFKRVKGLTVNKVHGFNSSIASIKTKYHADVETMEGAAFMYGCKAMDVDFIALRGISNYVEPRDKSKWKIAEAIDGVNDAAISYINDLLLT